MPLPAKFSVIYVKTVTFLPHPSPHLSPLIQLFFNMLSRNVTVWQFFFGKNTERKVILQAAAETADGALPFIPHPYATANSNPANKPSLFIKPRSVIRPI